MGFLDRFKKQREKEVEGKNIPAVVVSEKTVEEKAKIKLAKKTEEKKVKTHKPTKEVPENLANILVRPLVTEKTATLTEAGQYVFEVNLKANKVEVAAAIKAIYGVDPAKVKIQNVRREPVRFGRFHGRERAWKKAIICLPKGKTINVHEGI